MESFVQTTPWLLIVLLWILPWKVAAMWTAAKHSQEKWFVVLLLCFILPFGLLALPDLYYLFITRKYNWNQIKNIFKQEVS